MRTVTLDEDTGVILDRSVYPEGSRLKTTVQTPAQLEYLDTHVESFNNQARFGKLYVNMSRYIEKELTGAEWMFFYRLMENIDFENCVLRVDGDRRKKQLTTIQEIADQLGKTYEVCYKHIKSLINKELIIVSYTGDRDHRITSYRTNPYIFFYGKNLEQTAWDAFKDTRWAKYNDEICKQRQKAGDQN